MAELHMLSTLDNPFNPWTEYEEWDAFDQDRGYHTAAYLARVTVTSSDLSESDQELAIEFAIDEIIALNPVLDYIKVPKSGRSTG